MSPQAPGAAGRGRTGEEAAARCLERAGYRILARNFRGRGGEVDLVALDGPYLVFVEVKARRRAALAGPLEAVDSRKRRRLGRAAREYLARNGTGRPVRFDVVAVELDGTGRALGARILRDAFRP